MDKKVALILGHQGVPFFDSIEDSLSKAGLTPLIVCSKPYNQETLKKISEKGCLFHTASTSGLTLVEVQGALDKAISKGYEVKFCFATWEGYRSIMSIINSKLDANDSSLDAINLCLDKYSFRKHLLTAGHSKINVDLIDIENCESLKPYINRFIKPRSGAAAFACSRIDDAFTVDELKNLHENMQSDERFSSIFCNNFDFIVEDIIQGVEFSFEMAVMDEQVYILCIHEKNGIEVLERTILETMLITPPVSVNNEQMNYMVNRVSERLLSLGITQGVFHVEAMLEISTNAIELVEVNPRIGGLLINDSVALATEKYTLIEIWIGILASTGKVREKLREELISISEQHAVGQKAGTIQLCHYGEKGKTIEKIALPELDLKPTKSIIYYKDGDILPDAECELSICDLIWKFDTDKAEHMITNIEALIESSLHIQYKVK